MRHADPQVPLRPAGTSGSPVVVSRFNEAITIASAARGRARRCARPVRAGTRRGDSPCRARSSCRRRRGVPPRPGSYDAIVCLGCVIRGETPHFEYISAAVAHGLMEASGETGVPMAFGVLTTDTVGAGRGAGWRRPRQQGLRSGGRGARDGGVVRHAAGSAGRAMRSAEDRRRAEATARRAPAAALQMLYQWEVGRGVAGEAILTYWPAQEEAPALSEEHREFANPLVRGTTAARRRDRRLLAERAQNWRVERMAVLDRLVLRLATYELLAEPGDAGEGDHQRGARAGAHVQRRRGRRLRERRARRGEKTARPRE